MKKIIKFIVPVPKIGAGKHKDRLAVTNTLSYWHRWYKAKIKNTFKESMSDWVVPKSDLNLESGTIKYQLYRHNMMTLDADSIAASCGKWIADFLVEQGYFVDDDKITFIYKPVIVDKKRLETEVEVTVYE